MSFDGSDDESDDFSLNPIFQDVVLTSLWCPPAPLGHVLGTFLSDVQRLALGKHARVLFVGDVE